MSNRIAQLFKTPVGLLFVVLFTGIGLSSCILGPRPSGYKRGEGSQAQCLPYEEHVADPYLKARPSPTDPIPVFTVRFTDDGQFVKRCELTDVLDELGSGGPRLLVVYVHGWKHNADQDDPDLRSFTAWLAKLSAEEARQTNQNRRVVGLYIGWNGASMARIPGIEDLSFWSRKKAADLIAHSGSVTKVIGKIQNIDRMRRKAGVGKSDLTVYMGHSFGARILFSAISEVLLNETERNFPGKLGPALSASDGKKNTVYSTIEGVGDLVVLLNPAFEASFYGAFQSVVRPYSYSTNSDNRLTKETFSKSQSPLMLTLSAKNDLATKIAFPIGQIIGVDWPAIRRTTLGNFADAWTHGIELQVPPGARAGEDWWYDHFCDSQSVCLIRRREQPNTGDPFIVAQAPKDVMDGHGGIWSEKLDRFLIEFVSETLKQRLEIKASE